MYWIRRNWIGTTAAVAALAAALLGWAMSFSRPAPAFAEIPTAYVHAFHDETVTGQNSVVLTSQKEVPALVIVPAKLPAWAFKELKSRDTVHGKTLPQVIWNGQSKFFHEALRWNITGLYPTTIQEAVPRSGVSPSVIAAASSTSSPGRYLKWDGDGFAGEPGTVHTVLSLSLVRQLSSLVAPGGSVFVLSGNGAILDQGGNPLGKEFSWQPHPVGQALTPLMLAMALEHPQLFQGLNSDSPALLSQIAQRWSPASIQKAFTSIGIGPRPSISGQPLANPALPKITASVLASGRDLWATGDEVARAYLPFINRGRMPALHWRKSLSRQALGPLVMQPEAIRAVDAVIPTEEAGGITFHVWRPDANFMVAFTEDDGGMVVVLEGPATANALEAVQQSALWLSH